jgi:hypothetical protein
MRIFFFAVLATLLATGCSHTKQPNPSEFSALPGTPAEPAAASTAAKTAKTPVQKTASNPTTASHASNLIVTPETSLTGKVARVNSAGRFVVLSFPVGHLPTSEQQLNVYRLGLKVGEVKVSDLHKDDIVVADIVAGEVFEGDEVRTR